MKENAGKYYVVRQKALPEVLLKVVEAKQLLEKKGVSVQAATEQAGISRSSFYKYKDDIFPFHDNARGKTVTFLVQIEDSPGILSNILAIVADCHANVLTIHQTIPINGFANLTLSVEVLPASRDSSEMIARMEGQPGVNDIKILGRS